MQKSVLHFLGGCLLLIVSIAWLDHAFFKKNHSFCLRYIFSTLPVSAEKEQLPPQVNSILEEKFFYLAKGHQSFVFVSEDGEYILKFYRFPSHLRPMSWITHPVAYLFDKNRIKIKDYNLDKLRSSFESYRIAYNELKEESGLIYLHLDKTDHLKKRIVLVDSLGVSYLVDLDSTHFLVQKKGELIFPLLSNLVKQEKLDDAKKVIDEVIALIVTRCHKGIADLDPVLEKNYGWLAGKAIHLDSGRFKKVETLSEKEEVLRITKGLKVWLQETNPDLLAHYENRVDSLR